MDNSWVVPYNAYLSLIFNCHINVEIVNSFKSIKYLYKYVHKGYDCIDVCLTNDNNNNKAKCHDEPLNYLNNRYVSAIESCHRIFEFKMQDKSHSITRLAVHLPLQQSIYFTITDGVSIPSNIDTTLTAWFNLNKQDPEANKYLYTEIPEYYSFDKSKKCWKIRVYNSKIFL